MNKFQELEKIVCQRQDFKYWNIAKDTQDTQELQEIQRYSRDSKKLKA